MVFETVAYKIYDLLDLEIVRYLILFNPLIILLLIESILVGGLKQNLQEELKRQTVHSIIL